MSVESADQRERIERLLGARAVVEVCPARARASAFYARRGGRRRRRGHAGFRKNVQWKGGKDGGGGDLALIAPQQITSAARAQSCAGLSIAPPISARTLFGGDGRGRLATLGLAGGAGGGRRFGSACSEALLLLLLSR